MKNKIKNIILSICSSFCFFVNLNLFKDISNISYIKFMQINSLGMLLVFIISFYINIKNKKYHISKSKYILCWLFSFFMVLGESLATEETITVLYSNIAILLFSFVKIVGYINIFKIGFYYLDKLVNSFKNKEFKIKNKYFNWYIKKLEHYPFRTSFITIALIWSIYILAFYPIVLSPDPSYQILQYFNVPNKYIDWVIQKDPNVFMTTHHSVLHTYLLGWAITIGRNILNDNFGLFLYTVFQTIIYISTLAYSIKVTKNFHLSNKYCFVLLIIYLFVPMYGIYTVSANKDVLYTSLMLLFILHIIEYIKNFKDNKLNNFFVVRFILILIFLSLFRNNGLYIILLTLPFLLFYSKKNWIKMSMAFLVSLICIFSFNKILIPSLGISNGSIREMLSIPFQQTARYVKYYENDLSEKDKKVIDKILGYSTLAQRYDAELADPVKNEYNKNTTNEDLKKYFAVWYKGLIKHPDVYIDATLNNTYGYFYPATHNWYAYSRYKDTVTKKGVVEYYWSESTKSLRMVLTAYANIFPYIPLVGCLSNIGFGTWMILILSSYLITNKLKKYLIVLIPMCGSLLFCFLSPANTYFRYAMPYLFVLPVITLLLLNINHEKQKQL